MTLRPPHMPQPRMQSPEEVLVRAAKQMYESAKRELAHKAETLHRINEQYKRTQDPRLLQTREAEQRLYNRMITQIYEPAAKRYSDALRKLALKGQWSVERAVREHLAVDAEAQATGIVELSLATPAELSQRVDRVYKRATGVWRADRNVRALTMMCEARTLTAVFGATHLPSVVDLEKEISGIQLESGKMSVGGVCRAGKY